MKKAGIVILILGLMLTIFTTATFFTKKKVVDLGELEITANKRHHLAWSPLVGIGVMIAGGAILLISSKK